MSVQFTSFTMASKSYNVRVNKTSAWMFLNTIATTESNLIHKKSITHILQLFPFTFHIFHDANHCLYPTKKVHISRIGFITCERQFWNKIEIEIVCSFSLYSQRSTAQYVVHLYSVVLAEWYAFSTLHIHRLTWMLNNVTVTMPVESPNDMVNDGLRESYRLYLMFYALQQHSW